MELSVISRGSILQNAAETIPKSKRVLHVFHRISIPVDCIL